MLDQFFPVEYASDRDPSRNYCLWDYRRPAAAENKLRGVNLLLQSFGLHGGLALGTEIVEALRQEIGLFQTVFGIKQSAGGPSWEFYFYDYRRHDRQVSIPRVAGALAPVHPISVPSGETLPYFMFSVDIEPRKGRAAARALEVVHAYIGNPGSNVSSGVSYALRHDGLRLENFYFFFEPRKHWNDLIGKITNSPHFDVRALPIDAVLLPELRNCQTICVANKQTTDCIYFSGVSVDQLLWFLVAFAYPPETIDFVTRHRDALDHLLFDVGFDYTMEAGRLKRLKSGYYNVF